MPQNNVKYANCTFLKCGSTVGSKKLHVIDTTVITQHVTITDGIFIKLLNEPDFVSKFNSAH